MLAVGLVFNPWSSFSITTICSRGFGETGLIAIEESVVFLHLQAGQINTGPSFVRFKTILFPHEGQNSIVVSSSDRVIEGFHSQY